MAEQENKNDQKKESIQQQPNHVDDQKKQPVTPEPPQKKDPGAEATSDADKDK